MSTISSSSIILPTFWASLRSVGTAFTLASAGIYLQRNGFVSGEGKKTLALISQQVAIPCLLFTKIVYCNQDWSTEKCPSVTDSIRDVWVLLFWPIYVVGWGLIVGYLVARVTSTPPQLLRIILAACAFSNSTGVPITLLTVIHANFPSSHELGAIDPTVFLSIFLILYPMLQWGLGGFLLTPENKDEQESEVSEHSATLNYVDLEEKEGVTNGVWAEETVVVDDRINHPLLTRNVLNNTCVLDLYKFAHQGMQDTDASIYVSNANLVGLAPQLIFVDEDDHKVRCNVAASLVPQNSHLSTISGDDEHTMFVSEVSPLVTKKEAFHMTVKVDENTHHVSVLTSKTIAPKSYHMDQYATVLNTISKIMSRCFQPPVIGALLGISVASVAALRGFFVDLVTRSNQAPMQWFYDGLYALGQAAVPINMIILGSSLLPKKAKEAADDDTSKTILSKKALIGIVVGKMVIMPIIGVISCYVFGNYVWSIPAGEQPAEQPLPSSSYSCCLSNF
jgi:predicted permease